MILLYLDPGSGSFLIQLLIAGIAAGEFSLQSVGIGSNACSKRISRSNRITTRMTSNRAPDHAVWLANYQLL
jgi:hypothetical protein